MMPNNTLERTGIHCGRAVLAMDCVLGGAQWRQWSAAQLGRLERTVRADRGFVIGLIAAVPSLCSADDAVIYNHIAGPRTSLDSAIHEHFSKRYKVVDFSDKDHS